MTLQKGFKTCPWIMHKILHPLIEAMQYPLKDIVHHPLKYKMKHPLIIVHQRIIDLHHQLIELQVPCKGPTTQGEFQLVNTLSHIMTILRPPHLEHIFHHKGNGPRIIPLN